MDVPPRFLLTCVETLHARSFKASAAYFPNSLFTTPGKGVIWVGLPPLPNKTYLYTAHSWVIGGHQSNVFLYRPLLEYRRCPNQAYLYTAHSWSIGGPPLWERTQGFFLNTGGVIIGRRAPDIDPTPGAGSHDPPFLAEGPCAKTSRQNLLIQAGRCEKELKVFSTTAVGL